jgi:hypothetical protein
MKQKVESQLKNDVVVPKKLTLYASQYMGKQIKKEEVTPIKSHPMQVAAVEAKLKQEEVKPHLLCQGWSEKVKEQLKSEEVTPKEALPPFRWTNLKSEEIKPTISTSYRLEEKLKSEEIKPVKFYETELQFLEEQLKQEILKFNKNEKK